MATVMRSPDGEEATVKPEGVAAMRALGWTEREPASGSGEQSAKRRPGRPRKNEATASASQEPASEGDEES